jgi:hypothetical protein
MKKVYSRVLAHLRQNPLPTASGELGQSIEDCCRVYLESSCILLRLTQVLGRIAEHGTPEQAEEARKFLKVDIYASPASQYCIDPKRLMREM